MSAGYVVARENFKEAVTHVSAEKDPVMFNLLYGLQSLTTQIESDFAAVRDVIAASTARPAPRRPAKAAAPTAAKIPVKARTKKATKKTGAAKPRRKAGRGK